MTRMYCGSEATERSLTPSSSRRHTSHQLLTRLSPPSDRSSTCSNDRGEAGVDVVVEGVDEGIDELFEEVVGILNEVVGVFNEVVGVFNEALEEPLEVALEEPFDATTAAVDDAMDAGQTRSRTKEAVFFVVTCP